MSAAVSELPPPVYEAAAPPPDHDTSLTLVEMNADGEGATPLMYACQQARDAELRSIIAKKPSAVRERDRTLKTALHYCAENATLSCVEIVLNAAPELLDAKDEDGYTTLHLAVIAGNAPLIKLLLAKGADVNCLDNERHSVVHWAAVCGEVEALEIVLDAGATSSSPDMHGGYPLHYAAQMCGPTGDRDGVSRLGLTVLRTLLSHSVEVNVTDQDGRQPILWAASAGSADAILALVNAGANVEADDKDGLTALHCAASRGHTDCLETLITLCGASVDVMDSNGCTALFYAVTLGHADATQLLLEHGAQPNRQDRKGRTPGHCGAAKGQLETLRLLSSRGANMWARNVKGDYPLHEAVSSGRKDLVRWLLSQRPDAVNASNNDGRCPLHIAAINNNVELCKIILDCESLVNPVMRTNKGQLMTPLDAALHKGNRGCAKYLQLHGGVPANKLTSQAAALRGAQHRLEPHSDQLITPEWGPNLAVPDVRGAHSLMQSPVEYTGQKNLTVVDANTRTLEVRVQENINVHRGERRDSGSSSEERARRRRRKRRTRRDDGSEPTDSDDRRRRRRRRRERENEYDSDAENRRRRRKSRRSRDSDESADSDKDEKRSRRDKRHRRRRSSSRDRRSSSRDRKSNDERQRNDKTGRDKGDVIEDEEKPQKTSKHVEVEDDKFAEKGKESRKIITEAVETKEVVKSKRTVEHKEEEKSSSKPAVTKSTKTTNKEKKVEEQVTRKSSEIVQSGLVMQKQDETLSQDDQEIATQQVVTAIVHREETADTTEPVEIHEEGEDNVEDGTDKTKEFIDAERELSRQETREETEIKEDDTEEADQDRQESVEKAKIEEGSGREESGKEEGEEEDGQIEKGEEEHDDEDFWEEKEEERKEPETTEKVEDNEEETTEDKKLITQEEEKETEIGSKSAESDLEKHEAEPSKDEETADTVLTGETKDHSEEPTDSLEAEEIRKSDDEGKPSDALEHEMTIPAKERTSSELEQGESKLESDGQSEKCLEDGVKESSLSSKEDNRIEEGANEPDKTDEKKEDEEVIKDSALNELHTEESDERKESADVIGSSSIEKSISVEKRDESELTGEDIVGKDAKEILDKAHEEESGKSSSKKTSEEKVQSEERRDVEAEDTDNSRGLVKVLGRTIMSDDQLKGSMSVETKSGGPTRGRSRVREKQKRSRSSFEIVSPARSVGDDEPDSERTRSRNGADSSLLPDSGFEPSPRRDRTRFRRGDASRIPRACRRPAAQHPEEDINDDERIDLSTVSVTQAVQNSMRKYHLERRIFHELLELKRLQIRAGRSNEAVLVKRLVDDYRRAGLMIGLKQYDGVYTFRAFERFLYDQLRILQNSDRRLIPRLKPTDDLEKLTKALRRTRAGNALLDNVPENPIFCTYGTHRCYHATHAYTGIPCAAYISKLNHHTVPKPGAKVSGQPGFLPRIDSDQRRTEVQNAEIARCLRYVDPSRPVTLELSHGSEKQVISLPTEKLDKNKRYYVTFTIKGGESKSDNGSSGSGEKHQHSKSF